MFNNKYSKLLTVVLIVIILLVIGLLVYMAVDAFKGYTIEKENLGILEQFENTLTNVVENETVVDNVVVNDVVVEPVANVVEDPSIDDGNNNGGGSGSSKKKVTYNGYKVIGKIEIPATGIKYAILDTISLRALETAICFTYGAGLNQVGNSVLQGHNYKNGTFFSNNRKLKKGDKIYITDETGKKVTYVVSKNYETTTSDFTYATRDTNGKRAISLSTCTDDTKKRIIVLAEEQ